MPGRRGRGCGHRHALNAVQPLQPLQPLTAQPSATAPVGEDAFVLVHFLGHEQHADAGLVNTMLDAAIDKVTASGDRPRVHFDRGGHYRWPSWLSRIAGAKLVRSMSRKGCSPDNAACQGFFGRLKTEMFLSRDWLSTTTEEFVAAVDA